ncbi:O-antigen ligase family protein [Cytobacillus oceanisediminis]|uniref:O-antigen ligase family protein n=1 Tax=Cytobacillus oceanisediminis TaxID=665099 RepID=UPI001C237F98|nr:O-antigen ligase family protein [Cytobacillus oceanisediminis]MBU8771474.1 O-antigen ligase family protein [Cytobacillus oceanisediminis]
MYFSILLLLIVVLFEPLLETSFLPGIILILELVYLSFLILRNPKISIAFIFFCIYLVVLLAWSLLVNPSHYSSYIFRVFTYFSQLIIGTGLFIRVFNDPYKKKKVVNSFIVLIMFMAIYCIIEGLYEKNLLFSNLFREDWYAKTIYGDARGYRASGSMESPLVMSFPILLCLNFSYINLRLNDKKKYAIPFLLCLISLYFFQTRTVYLCAVICIFLVELHRTSKKDGKLKWNVLIFAILTFIIGSIYKDYLITLFTGNIMSYTHRLESIKFVLNLIVNQNPIYLLIGHGYGSLSYKVYIEKLTITTEGFYAIDNEYITVLYEIGILGLLLSSAVYVYLIKICKNMSASKRMLFITSSICYAIYLFSFNFFHWFSMATIAAFTLGAFISEKKQNRNKDEEIHL